MIEDAPTVLVLGDSLVAGYGLTAHDGFGAQLQLRLRATWPHARVVSTGVAGAITADLLRRLPTVLTGLDRQPDLAVVQVGPNDVLRRMSPPQVEANLSSIAHQLRRCAIPVLLTMIEPPAVLRDRAAPYQGIHARVARAQGAELCGFFPAGVLGHPDMVLPDGVHPNARAMSAVVAHLAPVIERMIAAAHVASAC